MKKLLLPILMLSFTSQAFARLTDEQVATRQARRDARVARKEARRQGRSDARNAQIDVRQANLEARMDRRGEFMSEAAVQNLTYRLELLENAQTAANADGIMRKGEFRRARARANRISGSVNHQSHRDI